MATIAEIECRATDFLLRGVMSDLPDAYVELESVVSHGQSPVVPLLWATGADLERIRAALGDDETVREAALLADASNGWLFAVEWADRPSALLDELADSAATILEAQGRGGRWYLWVLVSDRTELSRAYHRLESRDVEVRLDAVHEMDRMYHSRYGLTDGQREALVAAFERGYYDVPHSVSTAELGEELGISHQAVSQRLRRGHGALVGHTLVVGHGFPGSDVVD
ncbi:MAG: bacterio-opsin activator domain-containing protein [Salinigranum sp.]